MPIKKSTTRAQQEQKETEDILEALSNDRENRVKEANDELAFLTSSNKLRDELYKRREHYPKKQYSDIIDLIESGKITKTSQFPKPKTKKNEVMEVTDKFLTEQVSKHNRQAIKDKTAKANKLMAEVQRLMDEVSAFKMPEIKKPKLPRALKHAMSTKAKVPPPPPKKRTMSTKAVVPPAPKKKSKAQQEREMAEYINRPEVQTERRIKYILKKIAVNVQMMESAVDYMKYINKEKYEASAEIKETYKTNKKLFLHYRDEGIEELKELKQLSKEVSKETLEKEMSDSRAGEKFVEFNKLKTYKPKF